MLRHRIIPLVLLDGYSVVKTIQFDIRRNLGSPITVARVYNARNVDELILLDIDASKQRRGIDLHTVKAVASECFMPLTVGGGINTCDDIEMTLKAGADKVSLNSIFFEKPEFFKKAASVFGSQCIVASNDVKKSQSGEHIIYSHSGKSVEFSLIDCLDFLMESKVGEILLNSVDADGMMTGYDLGLINYVSRHTNIPIIVAGGAGSPADFSLAVKAGASAVAAASIFHFTSITPLKCKENMRISNIPVRI